MNSNSQSWNHYKKIRQQGKCTCTRLHKATFINFTFVLNSGDPWTVSFIQTTLSSPPPPPAQPFSSLNYQPNTLIPPHCNTIKATQHLKIMIWVWCRTLNTYSCMRQKKKHLLIIVMMKTVFVSRDERCANMIYKKKDNFIFWRNLWYHTIELKDIFIHMI